MKYKNVQRLVILLSVLCVVAGLVFAVGASAQGDTAVDISPVSQTVSTGQVFTVDVVVSPAVPIAGVQFDLSFDPSLLTADSVVEGDLLNQNGDPTFFLAGTIDNDAGTITGVAGTVLGAGATVSSPGTFATITFTAKTAVGTSPLDLSNVIVGDANGDPVAIVVTNGSATITDTTPPTITGTQAIDITPTSATIIWTTNEPADSVVRYGVTKPPTTEVSDPALVTSHSVTLSGLGTTYYYEVQSTDGAGNTAIDNNGGSYYSFTTPVAVSLTGWAWCTDCNKIAAATLEGNATMVERSNASGSFSLHLVGNLTLNAPSETVEVDMYGSRVRSLYYLRQEITGKSASFAGTWIDAGGGQYYILMDGMIALPNPEGESLKTARICFVTLRTAEVDVPLTQPGSFVEDLESMLTRFIRFIDNLLDSLIGTGIGGVLSAILAKLATLLAALRDLGVPYVP